MTRIPGLDQHKQSASPRASLTVPRYQHDQTADESAAVKSATQSKIPKISSGGIDIEAHLRMFTLLAPTRANLGTKGIHYWRFSNALRDGYLNFCLPCFFHFATHAGPGPFLFLCAFLCGGNVFSYRRGHLLF